MSNKDSAVSILMGYGFGGKKIGGKPRVILGAERRLGRRSYFLEEIPMDGDEVVFPLLDTRHQTLFRGWAFCLGVYLPLFNKHFLSFGIS